MDVLQNKINVIGWLTAFKGEVITLNDKKFVELNHKNQMTKFLISAPDEDALLKKLDHFLVAKTKEITHTISG